MDPGASTNDPSDEELVRRVLAGDRAAEYELDRRWRGRLFGLARRILRGDDRAEEAAQLAMWRVFHNLPRYDPARPLQQWILTIGRNTALDLLRREKARAKVGGAEPSEEPPDEEPGGRDRAAKEEELAALRGCIATLKKEKSRKWVELTKAGFSDAEIGRILHRSPNTILGWKKKALEHLRRCMEGRGFKDDERGCPEAD